MKLETIGEKIIGANWDGDIAFLQQMVNEKKIDPLHITEVESWNYLHRANLINPSPKETIQFYLNQGVHVNAQDCYGMTPLHYAMRVQNVDAAKLLLEAGADPNIPDEKKLTPLAYINGVPEQLDLLKLMLDKGGDVNINTGNGTILEKIKKYRSDEEEFIPVIRMMERYTK
ncbi:ankyrin repeat domain-containing protein [Psychrobacter sp. NZS113]|uniref:ankyrin repeat domain-containing protein n=1 Tax=Psychrobacter sp. NZS113 TaxID=2792045 RepID=UPI0018CE0DFD|nr:ankyrin repeat domain-containing protein [Psychrobacter sp. NZS113]MBH0096216.1 ankyrin repeat domain-containing protein [Psychrobacter sp. NZS113]